MRDLPNEANKKYVADFRAKHKTDPSFYGSQTYDAVPLLDSVVKAVKGDLTKKDEMRRAAEKADFKSVRGNFKFGPEPHPDPELLSAGSGQGRRRVPAEDGRHHRRERPGQALSEVQDAELIGR